MRKMTKRGKRRSRGAYVGMEVSEEADQVMQGSTRVVVRWEIMGRRTTGGKGKETEMDTEEGNGERGEMVGRVPLYLQPPSHPLPPSLPTSCPQRSPSPRLASLGQELCRRSLHRLLQMIHGAGREHTHHLTMDRLSPPLIPQVKTWRSQTRRRRRRVP